MYQDLQTNKFLEQSYNNNRVQQFYGRQRQGVMETPTTLSTLSSQYSTIKQRQDYLKQTYHNIYGKTPKPKFVVGPETLPQAYTNVMNQAQSNSIYTDFRQVADILFNGAPGMKFGGKRAVNQLRDDASAKFDIPLPNFEYQVKQDRLMSEAPPNLNFSEMVIKEQKDIQMSSPKSQLSLPDVKLPPIQQPDIKLQQQQNEAVKKMGQTQRFIDMQGKPYDKDFLAYIKSVDDEFLTLFTDFKNQNEHIARKAFSLKDLQPGDTNYLRYVESFSDLIHLKNQLVQKFGRYQTEYSMENVDQLEKRLTELQSNILKTLQDHFGPKPQDFEQRKLIGAMSEVLERQEHGFLAKLFPQLNIEKPILLNAVRDVIEFQKYVARSQKSKSEQSSVSGDMMRQNAPTSMNQEAMTKMNNTIQSKVGSDIQQRADQINQQALDIEEEIKDDGQPIDKNIGVGVSKYTPDPTNTSSGMLAAQQQTPIPPSKQNNLMNTDNQQPGNPLQQQPVNSPQQQPANPPQQQPLKDDLMIDDNPASEQSQPKSSDSFKTASQNSLKFNPSQIKFGGQPRESKSRNTLDKLKTSV